MNEVACYAGISRGVAALSCDVAFNIGGSLKLNEHINLLFTGGRDIVGETTAMDYIGLQYLTK